MTENEVKETKEWLQDFIRMFSCNFDDLETRGFNECVIFLKELEQYRAIGTVEELQELKENHIRCEDCAGCTSWKCDCANVRDYAIREFAERLKERIVGMQMAELQGEDMCPCAENGKECPYINQDIGCQYCAREHTIKEINEIAEELRGEEC